MRFDEQVQKIKTNLVPEVDVEFDPVHVREFSISNIFSRVFAHLFGQYQGQGVAIKATSSGELKVASVGSGLESYNVDTGTGGDTYSAGDTFEFTSARVSIDILVETYDAKISFKDLNGTWGDDKVIRIGFYSEDYVYYGIKIKNRTAGQNCVYEITEKW